MITTTEKRLRIHKNLLILQNYDSVLEKRSEKPALPPNMLFKQTLGFAYAVTQVERARYFISLD